MFSISEASVCVPGKVCLSSLHVCQARFLENDKHADQPPGRTCSSFPSASCSLPLTSNMIFITASDRRSEFNSKKIVHFWLQQSLI